MKFLIQNYTSQHSTQPLYLSNVINANKEHAAKLWDSSSLSLYDVMDYEKPDYFVTHGYRLSKDYLHYVKNEKSLVKLLLNVDDIPQNTITAIEDTLINNGLECCFFFSANHNVKLKKIRFVSVNNCFDSNLVTQTNLSYEIDKAFVVNSKNQLNVNYDGSFHFLSCDADMKDHVDINLPEINMCALYKNYREIIFRNIGEYIPQAFFDAIAMGNKVYYESDDEKVHSMIDKMLKPEKTLNYNDENKLVDFIKLKESINDKHTCINRTKTILSQIPS